MMNLLNGSSSFLANEELSDECKMSLATAGGCFVAGLFGLVLNCISPGSTALGGLLFVAAFYLVLGLGSYVAGSSTQRRSVWRPRSHSASLDRRSTRRERVE